MGGCTLPRCATVAVQLYQSELDFKTETIRPAVVMVMLLALVMTVRQTVMQHAQI
jgi:hypothetical protein